MIRVRVAALLVLAGSLAACAPMAGGPAWPPGDASEARTAHYVEAIRDQPPLLTAFLRRMPKGGDLHNHLSGAIYAESYVRWAADGGLCVAEGSLVLTPPPCTAPAQVPAAHAYQDAALYAALLDALSMRDFPEGRLGHDHFFATFGKFGAATAGHAGDMLAEVASRAAAENVAYLELMSSPGMSAARRLGASVGWDDDFARLRDKLRAAGLQSLIPDARHEIDAAERAMRQHLSCDGSEPQPGCAVVLRTIVQVTRTLPPAEVFAQTLLAFELARAEPRIVGVNFVAPEDDPVALRDYALHMRLLSFLHEQMPEVGLTLHAGELTLGLVPPEALRFHIRSAVEVAGARRIGHGVDALYEDDPEALLAEMARRRVLVEINLTSNDLILGVSGDRHPLPAYLRAGVPVALSTDDPGVSRIDLTHEYLRAALTYRLGYGELKMLARNSLEYAFLPGESLWRSVRPFAPVAACAEERPSNPSLGSACRDFLAVSERARLQWRLEAAFVAFEASPWRMP